MKRSTLVFLIAICLGLIVPRLCFIIDLQRPNWIGLMIVLTSLAWIAGRLLRLSQRIGLLIAALGFAMLIPAGAMILEPNPARCVVEVAALLISFGVSNVFAMQPFGNETSISSGIGFALGCFLTAGSAHWFLPSNILATHDLAIAGIGSFAIAIFAALQAPPNDDSTTQSIAVTSPADWVMLITIDVVIAMIICVDPLMEWETFAFSPGLLGAYLALLTVISLGVSQLKMSRTVAGVIGLLFLSAASAGFMGAWSASWVHGLRGHLLDGVRIGWWMLWFAGVAAGIGHGFVQIYFAGKRSHDVVRGIVIAGSAVVAVLLWMPHERTSLGLPAVIGVVGVAISLVLRKVKTGGSAAANLD